MSHLGLGPAIPVYDPNVLDTVDLDGAFVTVDSNRINVTFRQIFKLLRAIGPNMENFNTILSTQGSELARVAKENVQLTTRLKETDGKVAAHEGALQRVAEVQSTHTARLDALEKRIAAQERLNADFKDIGETLSKLRADIRQLQGETEGLDGTVRRHTSQLDAQTTDLKKLTDQVGRDKDRVTALYSVFEMDEKKVLTANAHAAAAAAAAASSANNSNGNNANGGSTSTPPPPPRKTSNGTAAGSAVEAVNQAKAPHSPRAADAAPPALSPQVQYLFTLPAFTALRTDCAASIAVAEARATAELERSVEKLNGDLSALRGRLAEKVDVRDYKPFEAEVRDALKRLAGLFANYDRLVIETQSKADKTETERAVAQLQSTKADKSDLLKMVTMDDIRALDKKIQDLSDAFDALLGKINLELANLRNMRNIPSGATNTTIVADTSDPSLPGRVLRLEAETRELFSVKADKFQLQELLRNLATPTEPARAMPAAPPSQPVSARSATPPMPSAAARPASATSGSRAPHTPLQYTSTSPPRNPPVFNKGRFSASAVLYDSDGNRTPASVTAARAVGNTEHLRNVARHVANRGGDIPDDHKIHVLP